MTGIDEKQEVTLSGTAMTGTLTSMACGPHDTIYAIEAPINRIVKMKKVDGDGSRRVCSVVWASTDRAFDLRDLVVDKYGYIYFICGRAILKLPPGWYTEASTVDRRVKRI